MGRVRKEERGGGRGRSGSIGGERSERVRGWEVGSVRSGRMRGEGSGMVHERGKDMYVTLKECMVQGARGVISCHLLIWSGLPHPSPSLSPLCSLYSISVHSAAWTCTGWRQPSTPLWPVWRTSSLSSSWTERYRPGLTPTPRWGSCMWEWRNGRMGEWGKGRMGEGGRGHWVVCDLSPVLCCAGDVCPTSGPAQRHIPEGSGSRGSLPTEDEGG